MINTLLTQFVQAQRHRRTQRFDRQAGFTILSALLALAIGATVTYGQVQGQLTKLQITDGQIEGDLFSRVRDAQNTYALENYPSLQADMPVLKNGITLAFGNTPGQSLAPRVEDLVAMGYLVNGTTPVSNKVPGAIYRVVFNKLPAGCAPLACDIVGDAYIDRPYVRTGTTEANGPSIGAFIERVGGDATVSLTSAPGVLISANQVQTTNPVAGGPAGVIGARVGFGSSGFGRFVVIGDSRDPKLRGGLTVGGVIVTNPGYTLDVRGNTSLRGDVNLIDPATGISCIDMLAAAGSISVKCQGLINARVGTFTSAIDSVRVGSNNAAEPNAVATLGRVLGQKGFFGGNGSVFGDNAGGAATGNPNGIQTSNRFSVVNGAGDENFAVNQAGVTSSKAGFLSSRLSMDVPVVVGTSCGSAAAVTPGTVTNQAATTALAALSSGGLATCVNGSWRAIAQIAAPGEGCAQAGYSAISSVDGRTLTCKTGVYIQQSDLTSSFVLISQERVVDNQLVNLPVCGQLGTGKGQAVPVLTGQSETSNTPTGVGSFQRRIEVVGSQWLIVLKDQNGQTLTQSPGPPLVAEGLLQSYCYY